MGNEIKSEKYRKLSIATLVIGILAFSLAITGLLLLVYGPGGPYDDFFIILINYVAIVLLVSAFVCGGIDLIRIKAGRHSNRGKRFDIAGIALAVISSLPFLGSMLLVVIFS